MTISRNQLYARLEVNNIDQVKLKEIVQHSLQEDIGEGDRTTSALVNCDRSIRGGFIAKDAGIIAGLEIARLTFDILDNKIQFDSNFQDSDRVKIGDKIAEVEGSAMALLSGERVALNFLQRMGGIATMTNQYIEAVNGTQAVILDTRKTSPGLRMLDKWAVRLGGGENHRFGLYDMILLKENHIKLSGSITEAVKQIKRNLNENKWNLTIEVEVKNHDELKEALELGIDRILLDNMTVDQVRKAVSISNHRVPLEVSGNVNLENVRSFAETGIDYISVGMLTHSVIALDISFLID